MSGLVPHPFEFQWSKIHEASSMIVTERLHSAMDEIGRGERSFVQLLLSNIGVIYDAMLHSDMDLRWDRINEKQAAEAAEAEAAAPAPAAAAEAPEGAAAAGAAGGLSKWNDVLKWRVSTVVSGAAAQNEMSSPESLLAVVCTIAPPPRWRRWFEQRAGGRRGHGYVFRTTA